jgi:hypothetical protein
MIFKPIFDLFTSGLKLFADMSKKRKDARRVKEDKRLAEAIRKGDSETVGKIRERRRKYKDLVILMIIPLFMVGCSTTSDIVLTEGTTPYKLAAGEYTDVHGRTYYETDRWSISEADLYRDTQELSKPNPFWENWGLEKIGPYAVNVLVLLIVLKAIRQKKIP